MRQNVIWAPWRLKYITKVIGRTKGCVFCAINKSTEDKKNFVFCRTPHCFAVLNIYPYNNGHIMVLPHRHVKDLRQLTALETHDLFALLNDCTDLLDEVLHPDGYNIGMNIGRAAGAGFPGHVHIHIVPRWNGDVNFMPVLGKTKVISQSMQALYDQLIKVKRARVTRKRNHEIKKSEIVKPRN